MAGEEPKAIVFTVKHSPSRDPPKRFRAPLSVLKRVGLEPGDVVVVRKGRRAVSGTIWPALDETEEQVIYLPAITRELLEVAEGEEVEVERVSVKPAKIVVLAPAGDYIEVDEGFLHYVKKKLVDKPLIAGEPVPVTVLDNVLYLKVLEVKPEGPVVVKRGSQVVVRTRGHSHPYTPKVERVLRVLLESERSIRHVREIVESALSPPQGLDPDDLPRSILVVKGVDSLVDEAVVYALHSIGIANVRVIRPDSLFALGSSEAVNSLWEFISPSGATGPLVIAVLDLDKIAGAESPDPGLARAASAVLEHGLRAINYTRDGLRTVVVATVSSLDAISRTLVAEFSLVVDASRPSRSTIKEVLREVIPLEWYGGERGLEEILGLARMLPLASILKIPLLALNHAILRGGRVEGVRPGLDDIRWAIQEAIKQLSR
ncbi:MAG: hypothetical protein F7C35_00845 [Desulfurococcales archaeon]|nr:hypothetical protein [Desulfurococcales archaeon]